MLLDFDSLERPALPHHCLALPEAWGRADGDLSVPTYAVTAETLREALVSVAAESERTNLLELDREATQAEFMQKSKLFGFVDFITVAFVPLSDSQSSLAIYSRSKSGFWDLGVNRRRTEAWLARLKEKLSRSDEHGDADDEPEDEPQHATG